MQGRLIGGRYRVVRRLGSGGMASVYLAEDERLGRPTALKRMHSELDPGLAERFQREARLGASLNHPNVVKVFDVVNEDEDGVTTLVLEYVDGETLAEVIRRGPLAPAQALEVLEPLADALDHAHENGVVHRDIKPANVLIGRDGSVKLADLGVATGVDLTRVTSTGTALGSAAYMAPEQLAGEQVGAAADIYAFATIAFETLTGRRARTADSPMAIVHQVANGPPPDLTEAWPEAPHNASAVLKRGMADMAEDRPESAAQLVRDLEDGLRPTLEAPAAPLPAPPLELLPEPSAGATTAPQPEHTPAPQPPPEPMPTPQPEPVRRAPAPEPARPAARPETGRRRTRVGALAVGLAVLALAAVVVVVVLSGGEEASPPEAQQKPPAKSRRPAGPSPDSVVRSFYTLAAKDQFEAAWKLAGSRVRSQLGGFEAFKRQLATLESVSFEQARVTRGRGDDATVAIATRAVHTNKVDNCRGDVSLTRAGESWLIDRLGVSCS